MFPIKGWRIEWYRPFKLLFSWRTDPCDKKDSASLHSILQSLLVIWSGFFYVLLCFCRPLAAISQTLIQNSLRRMFPIPSAGLKAIPLSMPVLWRLMTPSWDSPMLHLLMTPSYNTFPKLNGLNWCIIGCFFFFFFY